MSVLIKGMEMPKSCYACDFSFPSTDSEGGVHTICTALQEEILPLLLERQEDCPLVEIPPHGDLIDADAMKSIIETYLKIQEDWATETVMPDCKDRAEAMVTAYINCVKAVGKMPTVIEAEEGE